PAELKQVVARCLAKQPDQRFQSAGELAMALKRVVASEVDESLSPPAPLPRRGEGSEGAAEHSEFPTRPCVPVLPLQNFSAGKTETDYIVDGMTEVLIAELAKNRALRVVSRTTMMQFKESRSPLRPIARELGADAIVEGSVLLVGPSVRITAQLIR